MRPKQRILFSAAAASLITLAAVDAPGFALAAGQTDRDAQLLVCGTFPDKKLTVSEQDLDDIVSQFSADTVPIKLEHVSTVLDPFGLVKKLWRDGKKLMATIGFDADAAPLLANRPVKRLSVGLDRDQATKKLSLAEVSLVLKPRLATAALLSDDDHALQIEALRAKLTQQDVDAKILELKRAGKVVPAIEALARALLSADDGAQITLSDGSPANVADTALRLLQALPRLVKFGETAAGKRTNLYGGAAGAAGSTAGGGETPDEAQDEDDLPELTADQMAYCRDVLKVDPAKVRENMRKAG